MPKANDTLPPEKPQGRDDPKGWQHGGHDTLRDTEGGTYGTLPGTDDPDQMKQHVTPHERLQQGADVRSETDPLPETLPEGLQRERKGSEPVQTRKPQI